MTFSDLLQATSLVERDNLHRLRIGKFSCVRVVKPDMAIFTDSEKGNIGRRLGQQIRISSALLF